MRKRQKILLVEEDLSVLGKIYFHLLHKGFQLEATNSSDEIKQRADRFKPKLIILSSTIKDLTNEILNYLMRQHVPVLYLTPKKFGLTFTRSNDMESLEKPVDLDELDDKVKEMLHSMT